VSRFLERLESGPVIVGDGGTGALLAARVPRLRVPEEANIRAPEAVIGVHTAFIRAGAELVETNTFGANRRKLSALLLEHRLDEIVERGVKLAREAREIAGAEVFVAGSIGPLGDLEGTHGAEDAYAVFLEQATLLEGRGVDLFMVETFFDLEELEAAVAAVRSVSSLPIVAQLTFDEDAETLAGVAAREAAERLSSAGVAAVGANCGLGPGAALAALAEMAPAANGLALAAQPNVGLPSRSGGRIVYPNATPDYFAEFAARARSLGARIVGGCCGTTPAQIAAIRGAVESEREPRVPLEITEGRDAAELVAIRPARADERGTLLQRKLEAGEWVVSVELDPPKGTNMTALLDVAMRLKASGLVDEVDVNDNPMARARLSALNAALTSPKAARIACWYCASAARSRASAASVRAWRRPPAKIGWVTAAATCQVAAAPPAKRLESAALSLPRNAVSAIEGNISARATPMRAFAAASWRSASTRSGRCSRSSEGRPAGTAGAPGASFAACFTLTVPSNTCRGLRPSSTESAASSRSRSRSSGGSCARTTAASASSWRSSNSEITPPWRRRRCSARASARRATVLRVSCTCSSSERREK